jgi:type VI secretion system protein ImpA
MAEILKTTLIKEGDPRPIDSLNIEAVLTPLGGDDPFNIDFRYSSEFDAIKAAKASDDPELLIEGDAKTANWPEVARMCQESLETKSKDLLLVFWLVEAWVHQYGFYGAVDGFNLAFQCIKAYLSWAVEKKDTESLEMQLACISWVNARLPVILSHLALTVNGKAEVGDYSARDANILKDPSAKQELAQKKEDHKDSEKEYTRENYESFIKKTPVSVIKMMNDESKALFSTLLEMEKFLDEFSYDEAVLEEVDVYRVKKQVETINKSVDLLLQIKPFEEKVVEDTASESEGADEAENTEVDEQPTGKQKIVTTEVKCGPIIEGGREVAYIAIQQAYDSLKQTEPHSPVLLLLSCALQWQDKGLQEIMQDLSLSNRTIEDLYQILSASEGGGAGPSSGADSMQHGGFPPEGGGFPPEGGGFPPEGGGFPPEGGGFPPEGGGFPPEGGGFPPEGGGFPPEGGGFPPEGGGFSA